MVPFDNFCKSTKNINFVVHNKKKVYFCNLKTERFLSSVG